MPTTAEILSNITRLKTFLYEDLSSISEVDTTKWDGKSHGTSFTLAKHEGLAVDETHERIIFSLRLKKGSILAKRRVRKEFVEALGKPRSETRRFLSPLIVLWNSTEALQHAQQAK